MYKKEIRLAIIKKIQRVLENNKEVFVRAVRLYQEFLQNNLVHMLMRLSQEE